MLKTSTRNNKKSLYHFIVDDNNMLAFEIANKLIRSLEEVTYNPIHFFGPKGVGKTHLIKAIEVSIKNKYDKTTLLSAKKFYYEYIYSLKERGYQNFRNSYRDTEVLLIEDLDFLRNKISTQKELLFLVNELLNSKRMLISTSEIHPKQLKGFLPALINRISCGLFVPMQHIFPQTIKNYFFKMAKRLNVELDEKILDIFGKNNHIITSTSIEKIEKLFIFCAENQENLKADLVQQYIKTTKKTLRLTKEIILQKVAEYYNVDPIDILDKRGTRTHKEPRYIAIALIKEFLTPSNLEIQEYFGLSSESSIRYALKTIKEKSPQIYLTLQSELERTY